VHFFFSMPFSLIGFFLVWFGYKFFSLARQVVIFNIVSLLIGLNSNMKAYIF